MTVLKKIIMSILFSAGICFALPPGAAFAQDNECGAGIFSTACNTFKSLETIEITAPDRFLYSILDGGMEVQQFTRIRANIRSLFGGQALAGGELKAVATYRLRTNYQSDLSADPPSINDREANITTSISQVVMVENLPAQSKTEFVFNFSSSPIPVGITDLRFAVFYKGVTAGNAPVFAYGTKDLNEPHHLLLVNSTDRVYLDHELITAAYVRTNDLGGFVDAELDPYTDVRITVKVYAERLDDLANAYSYDDMSSAKYTRIIFLTDEPEFTILAQFRSESRYDSVPTAWEPYTVWGRYALGAGVVNQGSGGSFENTQIETFRGKSAHTIVEFVEYHPDNIGVKDAEWPYDLYEPPIPVTVWP